MSLPLSLLQKTEVDPPSYKHATENLITKRSKTKDKGDRKREPVWSYTVTSWHTNKQYSPRLRCKSYNVLAWMVLSTRGRSEQNKKSSAFRICACAAAAAAAAAAPDVSRTPPPRLGEDPAIPLPLVTARRSPP